MSTECEWCGMRALGLATIGEDRYCHDGASPTCFELASMSKTDVLGALALMIGLD